MTTLRPQPAPAPDTPPNALLVDNLIAGATQTHDPLLRAESACRIGAIKYYDDKTTRNAIDHFIRNAAPDNLREVIDGLTFALETNTPRHHSQLDPATGLLIEPTYAPAYPDLNPTQAQAFDKSAAELAALALSGMTDHLNQTDNPARRQAAARHIGVIKHRHEHALIRHDFSTTFGPRRTWETRRDLDAIDQIIDNADADQLRWIIDGFTTQIHR